jgi:hypothetical protein
MPFRSKAQRRKFAELLVAGEISPETYEERNRETGAKRLPERVTRKKNAKSTSTRTRKTSSEATRARSKRSRKSSR